MRKRLFEIIEVADPQDKLSHGYDLFMLVTILSSLIPLCTKSTARWTVIVDLVTVSIFVIDYILREMTADFKFPDKGVLAFILYPFSFLAIIDLLSILPSFGVLGHGVRILKVFRLFRTLKVIKALKAVKALKLLRYSKSISRLLTIVKEQKEPLLAVVGLAIGYTLLAALIIFNVEPDTFSTFFEAIYWACVSLTTVGYGDIYPISVAGRMVAMLSSIVGIAIVALPSGIITAAYMDIVRKERDLPENPDEEE